MCDLKTLTSALHCVVCHPSDRVLGAASVSQDMVQRLTELLDHEAKEASELQVSDGGWGWGRQWQQQR